MSSSSLDDRVDKIKNILETALDDEVIESFIEGAQVFLAEALTSEGKKLSNELRTQVEMWLTAHMIAISREKDQTAIDMGAGGAYIKYSDEFGQGLLQTSYGQMAIVLDVTRTLKKIAGGKKEMKFKAIPNDTYND